MSRANDVGVREARWPGDIQDARDLLRLYAGFLLSHPAGPVSICMQDFERELDSLPLLYPGGSTGVLLLAHRGAEVLGCVAVRTLAKRPEAAEMKRLYVAPAAQRLGIGRLLVEAAIGWARQQGASELLLDTVPAAMPEAVRLYGSLGFCSSERYHDGDLAGLEFFRLDLR